MKTLNAQLNLPDDSTDEERLNAVIALQNENAAMKADNAQLELERKQLASEEAEIEAKMRHGLSREQAIGVIKTQREFEAAKKGRKSKTQTQTPGADKHRKENQSCRTINI